MAFESPLERLILFADLLERSRPTETITVRLARMLQELAEPSSQPGQYEPIQVIQERLADMIGATRESVNRVLNNLENSGYVSLGRGKIQILDMPRFETDLLQA